MSLQHLLLINWTPCGKSNNLITSTTIEWFIQFDNLANALVISLTTRFLQMISNMEFPDCAHPLKVNVLHF